MAREKIVMIGAGSAVFTRGLVADMILRKWNCELALVDVRPESLTVAEGLVKKMIEAKGAPVTLTASTDRRAVLEGATAIICTVGVGGRRAWEQDVIIPRKYGIYQPVGDTVMPGGASRALRMIPAMVDVAKDVVDVAPDALFFNYGNPMTPVCRAVRKATGAHIVGLCHGVPGVARYLEAVLEIPRGELDYTAVGLNHLTWFVEARHKGRDMMPKLAELAATFVPHWAKAEAERQTQPVGLLQRHPFSWHLLHLFGAFPAVLDRHVVEFFPQFFREGRYYGRTLGKDVFSFEETVREGDRVFERMREDATSREPLRADYFDQFGGEHEQVLDIIESLRTGDRKIYSANLPNEGQVPNLPNDAVIESPAAALTGRLAPVSQPPLPAGVAGAVVSRLAWVEAVVEAALEGDRRKFVQGLVLEGSVPSLEIAEKLAADLIAAQAEFLPQFKVAKA